MLSNQIEHPMPSKSTVAGVQTRSAAKILIDSKFDHDGLLYDVCQALSDGNILYVY